MTLRIGWLSPLTPASGVGTFSHAIATHFPRAVGGESVDLTMLYPEHEKLHATARRSVRIEDTDSFRNLLGLFDLLVYNIGNNVEHHETIFRLLRTHPGIVVCHDYVYQHYLADRSMQNGGSFASFAALLMKFGDGQSGTYLSRSRITSRFGKIRYSPWDSEASATQPMSDAILRLGSALVVHSCFAETYASKRFEGPILRLGMPHDQKMPASPDTFEDWERAVAAKTMLHMVSFGHIQSTKCIDLVIEAISTSKTLRRKMRYTIAGFVGDWDYLRRLESMVAEAGLRESIRFETEVSDVRLAELSREADLFVNLRKPNTEGSSASLIEQLDSGRPVVVLDSGCYAELPRGAAVKLPADAGAEELRVALEKLVAQPDCMPKIGEAGRAFARRWTCASYGERLVSFALEQRDLLARRGAMIAVNSVATEHAAFQSDPCDEAWTANLARARAALRYLDRNLLVLDPELVMRLSADDLCVYVAQIVFGIFDDARLHRALSRFFAGHDARGAYWACARFALIVEAVLAGSADARQRLAIIEPCFEPEFWDVIEAFPPTQYVAIASLLIRGRDPIAAELALVEGACDAMAKRRALLEMLRAIDNKDATATKLERWLERPLDLNFACDLPSVETNLDFAVGSSAFHAHADLSGFYAQEADHAWTRGPRGFVGMRLGASIRSVNFLVRSIAAEPGRPVTLRLSSGTATAEIEVSDADPHAIALDISPHLARSGGTTWLQLSTSRASSPAGSNDTRVLGVCLLQLKLCTTALIDELSVPVSEEM